MWQRADKESPMDLDGWKTAVDMCYEVGVRWIELFGGDAFLRKDIVVPITEYIKKYPGLECNMPTNANLLDKNTAEGLVRAGMDDIWISIDGVDSAHDLVRGKGGTFGRVTKAIENLLQMRGDCTIPRVRANCTISKYNVHSFEEVLPFAENKGMDAVHLEYVGEFWQETLDKASINGIKPTPYFIRCGNETALVSEDEAHFIKEKVHKMKNQASTMRVKLYTENIDKLTIDNMVKGRFDNSRCYITRFKVSIDPSGFVIGCPFYDEWKMGNIKQQHLNSIWNNEKHEKFIKAFEEDKFQFCNYCVMGVQRNPTFFQQVRDEVNGFLGRVRM
jgi:MoaA/NifB/PqqE/SkfB family radical SAM enzyme